MSGIWRRRFHILPPRVRNAASPSSPYRLLLLLFVLLSPSGNNGSAGFWRHSTRRLAVTVDDEGDFIPSIHTSDGGYRGHALRTEYPRHSRVARTVKYEVSHRRPIHILFPLPLEKGHLAYNPFGLTIDLARPVVDEALADVYRRQLVPPDSFAIEFADTKLSDAHGPNVAVNALVNNKLDCIIGYAFVYAVAIVARMTPYWKDVDSYGIPLITTVGPTNHLSNKKEYSTMTRMTSPYKVVTSMATRLFVHMNWTRAAYVYYDSRYMDPDPNRYPPSECYHFMTSLYNDLSRLLRMDHNYFQFNDDMPKHNLRERLEESLRKSSFISNGKTVVQCCGRLICCCLSLMCFLSA